MDIDRFFFFFFKKNMFSEGFVDVHDDVDSGGSVPVLVGEVRVLSRTQLNILHHLSNQPSPHSKS